MKYFFLLFVSLLFAVNAVAQDNNYLGAPHESTVSYTALKLAVCVVAPDSITVSAAYWPARNDRESYSMIGIDQFLSDTTSITGRKVHAMSSRIIKIFEKDLVRTFI